MEEWGKQSAEYVVTTTLEVMLQKHLQLRVLVASMLDVERLTQDSYFDQIFLCNKAVLYESNKVKERKKKIFRLD